MTDKEIVTKANSLARQFYLMQGHLVNVSYQFYSATHPQEVLCWRMATLAFDELPHTDVENALCSLGN